MKSTNEKKNYETENINQSNADEENSKIGESATADPFDPERLRLSQDYASSLGVKKALLTIPVRKPAREWWFRTHPDLSYQVETALLELKEEDWDKTISTNLKGTFLCTQAAGQMMKDQGNGGSIINIGSGANKQPFLNLIDPSTNVGNMNYSNFPSGKRGAMVPDDPGPGSPDRVWRRLASLVSAGISYREPGLKASLHIAIRSDSADVHLDREGFVHSLDGRISYNPRMVINHLSADLLSDHVPLLVSSLRIKNKDGKNTFEGNFAPWLEVNLPGSTDISGQRRESTGVSIGFRLFGIFEAGGG